MFKPLHVLQATFLLVLTSGCATTTPLDMPQPETTPIQNTVTREHNVQIDMNMVHHPAPIRSGTSIAQPGPLLNADGSLPASIQAYAADVAHTRQIPLAHVEKLLGTVSFSEQAYRLMSPGKTRVKRSWVTYRNRFVEPIRIDAGVRFWRDNKRAIEQAAERYGVPASILVAIIGVETIYGRYTGNFRVIDALATLGFRYPDANRPERSQLFRDQLADLIQLDYQGKLDANEATGSFAGAMGLPQFMPGSLLRYAADGNQDGQIDLLDNTEDAVNSVARFLRLHGWIPGLPVFAPVSLSSTAAEELVTAGLEPNLTWAQMQAKGATTTASNAQALWTRHPLGVVNLVDEPRNLNEYRVATPNFFAITQYNRSYFYAASVADLAKELAQRMGQTLP